MAQHLEAAVKQLAYSKVHGGLINGQQLDQKARQVAEPLADYKKRYQRPLWPAYASVGSLLWLSTAVTALFVWKWLSP